MQSRDRQERATQAMAWLWVAAVHAGLFWLLVHQDQRTELRAGTMRMRLVFVSAPPVAAPEQASPARPRSSSRVPARPPARRPVVVLSAPTVEDVGSATAPLAPDLQGPAPPWTRAHAAPSFQADPLRSRRAHLPGGERADAFRMKEPMSPARMLTAIARTFGDKDPCPNIRSRVSGLLASTSDHDRELLQEELRRDRAYCRP